MAAIPLLIEHSSTTQYDVDFDGVEEDNGDYMAQNIPTLRLLRRWDGAVGSFFQRLSITTETHQAFDLVRDVWNAEVDILLQGFDARREMAKLSKFEEVEKINSASITIARG